MMTEAAKVIIATTAVKDCKRLCICSELENGLCVLLVSIFVVLPQIERNGKDQIISHHGCIIGKHSKEQSRYLDSGRAIGSLCVNHDDGRN